MVTDRETPDSEICADLPATAAVPGDTSSGNVLFRRSRQ